MDKCKNCGDDTNLKCATGPRQAKGWCVSCFKTWENNNRAHGRGVVPDIYYSGYFNTGRQSRLKK